MRTIKNQKVKIALQLLLLGFWSDFYVETEEEWSEIERAYEELFYEFAKLSEEFPEVKLLAIGNELKEFTKRRPNFLKR